MRTNCPGSASRVKIPIYELATKEDHIAPATSVFKGSKLFGGPIRFVLAGSGHIAGVVNPPSSRKYQYWTNGRSCESLEQFVAGATETPGSWWPHWIEWLRQQDQAEVPAKNKRKPGKKGDAVLGDAPGSYVMTR